MCSIEQRLAEIGRAIDELAAQASMPAESETRAAPGGIRADSTQPTDAGAGAGVGADVSAGAPQDGESVADDRVATDTEDPVVAIEPEDPSRIVARLAELWGLLAELDPEVAKRVAGYQALLWPASFPERPDANSPASKLRPVITSGRHVSELDDHGLPVQPSGGLPGMQLHQVGSGAIPAIPGRRRCISPGRNNLR